MPLSDTALTILNAAAQREDRHAELPAKLPTAARNAVARSLVKQGLLDAIEDDALRITDAGFRALNLEPPQQPSLPQCPHSAAQESVGAAAGISVSSTHTALYGQQGAAVATPRWTLRSTAQSVLDARPEREAHPAALASAMDQLRAVIAPKPVRAPGDPNAPRKPREGTKQQAVLDLLRRDEGATIAQIVAATAWAQHTVRGFLANLKRKGVTVEVLERVRAAAADGAGAKGSFSIYRIAAKD